MIYSSEYLDVSSEDPPEFQSDGYSVFPYPINNNCNYLKICLYVVITTLQIGAESKAMLY